MQLEHSFTVPVVIDDAWRVLLDIELIAPCLPGAVIDSVAGDDFTGTVKVKLSPIGLTYKGRASFVEKDQAAHRAVIDARGRDARGNGTANAKVTATLTESGTSTRVTVLTDLDITGRPAQFGRGVMVDVGNKLIGQFADCLAGKLTGGAAPVAPAAPEPGSITSPAQTEVSDEPPNPSARPRPRKSAAEKAAAPAAEMRSAPVSAPPERAEPAPRRDAADVEPIDLVASAGPAMAKRLAPVAALVLIILIARRRRGR
ncbi:MAG: SRPBCC family protein [Jatrophihabitantaceae bacterium]